MSGGAECRPSWPASSVCGSGHCVEGTCVCSQGYQREGFLIITDSCVLNTETIVVFAVVQAIACTFSTVVGLFYLALTKWAYTKSEWDDPGQQRILIIRLLFSFSTCGMAVGSMLTVKDPQVFLAGHDLIFSFLWAMSYSTFHFGIACWAYHAAIFFTRTT